MWLDPSPRGDLRSTGDAAMDAAAQRRALCDVCGQLRGACLCMPPVAPAKAAKALFETESPVVDYRRFPDSRRHDFAPGLRARGFFFLP